MSSSNSSLESLQGQIERITYTNEENGYTVAKLNVKGYRNLVTVIGNISAPLAGQVLTLKGEWSNHPKYGEQFKAEYCYCSVPATEAGIQKYLGSGLIKGIGPVMAKRIVKKFKSDTLDIIENETDRLTEVEGIGKKRIEMIKNAWEEQKEVRNVMLFLQSYGVSTTYATKIFKTYGQDSIEIVKNNPYRLATDIFGIGFITADKIAQKIGFSKDSSYRLQAGILYVLHNLSEDGHVFYPYQELITKCNEILEVDTELIKDALDICANEKQVVQEKLYYTDREIDAVYLTKYYFSETSIAVKLKNLLNQPKSIRSVDTQKAIDWVQKTYTINLADKQKKAVKKALENKILVITGGPGTGKSFLLNAILKNPAPKGPDLDSP